MRGRCECETNDAGRERTREENEGRKSREEGVWPILLPVAEYDTDLKAEGGEGGGGTRPSSRLEK